MELCLIRFIEAQGNNTLWFFVETRIMIILGCWLAMSISCFIDMWSGVSTAKALGEKIMSKGLRKTISKMGDYTRILIFAFLFDSLAMLLPFYNLPYATMLVAAAIMLIEGKSVVENSHRKKSHAADIPEIVKRIVQASTSEQGKDVLNQIIKTCDYEHNN